MIRPSAVPTVAVLAALSLLAAGALAQPPADHLANAAAGLKTLQAWYVPETGLWQTTNWWNAANGVTMIVDYSKLSGSAEFRPVIANTFERNSHGKFPNFLNEYWDDEGWWALAWAGAYELTHEARYLEMADQIFADMTKGWDDTCGGGIWWRKDKRYKNAIANELFLSVAANLANLTKEPKQRATYLDWAQREWLWFLASGMINAENLVNDGLDSACHNNHRNTWTYNQGVILGGLSTLAKQTGEAKLLDRAHYIASAAISQLADKDGILHDTCEPSRCGNDAVQFKGIFVRNLATLNAAAPDAKFRSFLQANAEKIWQVGDPDHRFGVVWSGPSEVKNAATQISALDALVAAAESARTAGKP
ncbi:MAG: glycoside hydrolase family 76 protein [Acidobacteriota bacterium]|nr:glycoside hydrolase family 76 protein [Acidobacteriota bacterium]